MNVPLGFGPYRYFNDGLSFCACAPDYVALDGEVVFADFPTEEELATAFPNQAEAIAANAKAEALAQTVFSKLKIRRAVRALGTESQLNSLLASDAEFSADWADAQDVDLSDLVTAKALASASIDTDSIKLQIAGLS